MAAKKKMLGAFIAALLAAGGAYYYIYSTDGKVKDIPIPFVEEDNAVTRKDEPPINVNSPEVHIDRIDENRSGNSEEESQPVSREVLDDTQLPFAEEYYSMFLTDEEQLVCRQLYSGVKSFDETVYVENNTVKSDEIVDMLVMCVSSAPDIDYLRPDYAVSVDADGFVTAIDVNYSCTPEEHDSRKAQLDEYIDSVVSAIGSDWSDFEKYKYIHDTIALACEYDENGDDAYTAYGCLIGGNAVCEGYSKALMLICERAGIPCLPVVGQGFDNEDSQGHIWNKVKLDGEWYATDVTWDDPIFETSDGSYVRYDFFAVTDEIIDRNHAADENRFFNYPACSSVENDYFIHTGCYAASIYGVDQAMRNAVELAMSTGSEYARIRCGDEETFRQCLDWVFGSGSGSEDIFAILQETSERYPEGNYSGYGYSIINNSTTYTVSLRLRFNEE